MNLQHNARILINNLYLALRGSCAFITYLLSKRFVILSKCFLYSLKWLMLKKKNLNKLFFLFSIWRLTSLCKIRLVLSSYPLLLQRYWIVCGEPDHNRRLKTIWLISIATFNQEYRQASICHQLKCYKNTSKLEYNNNSILLNKNVEPRWRNTWTIYIWMYVCIKYFKLKSQPLI